MNRTDFYFELPQHLIAQYPLPERCASRLLCLERKTGERQDRHFADLVELLQPGDLLVCNDTRVIPARLAAHKASGGRVEILVERLMGDHRVLAQLRASKPLRHATRLQLDRGITAEVVERREPFYVLEFDKSRPVESIFEQVGHVPLPPYIDRADEPFDRQRYQTVFARQPGAVAAPTAGLHFDQLLLNRCQQRGIAVAYITLHVGAGTFQPLRVDDPRQHHMHAERVTVSATVCDQINSVRRRGGRVIAVGTTVVRSLEAASASGQLQPYDDETDIYILPGHQFRSVDALITNFHFPESTLLMLVSAFAGREAVLDAYQHAIEQEYRFFSYGDAMFIS